MESLSGKTLVMVVQPRQYWISDNISSFLLTEPINLSANAFMLGAFADILISSIPKP